MPARLHDPSPALLMFGDRLRAHREKQGLAQRQLAERIGLSRSSVANMEAGRQEPGIATLAALGAALDITVDMLVTGANSPAEQKTATVALTWHDLEVALESAAEHHRKLAETAWQEHRYTDAIRYRAIADGLQLGLNQHRSISTGKPDINHWSNWTTSVPSGCGMPAHL